MLRRTLLILPCFAGALAAACSSESGPAAGDEGDLSAVHQVQMATRVFRKLVGRDPSPAELAPLREAPLGEMVDKVLALPDFEKDGFYNFQRDRLLLHRDGDASWMQNSLSDYCGLRMEMEDVARADKSGGGYYDILTYRDRWVPVQTFALGVDLSCTNLTVADMKKGFAGTGSELANDCAFQIRNPAKGEILALDASFDDKPLMTTAPMQAQVTKSLKESLFKENTDVSLVLDAEGKPEMRVFDGPATESCTMKNGFGVNEPSNFTVFMKMRVPPELEGVHGSMYWLSRHGTTKKNRSLHRARLLFFSYMCTEISPAMATAAGGPPEEIDELKDYFDPADQHVRTAANCYNCHTQVQPVANYFGEMTTGNPYSGDFEDFGGGGFLALSGGFRRPGGLWKGTAFAPPGAGKFAMDGLAEMLSGLESSHDCIARNAWSSLVGTGHPLTDDERAAAVKAFKGDGTFRFQNLLRHFVVDSERGRAFFEDGEAGLEAKAPRSSVDCRDVANVPEEATRAAETLLTDNCAGCHTQDPTRGFYEEGRDGLAAWKPERLVGPGLPYSDLAQFYDTAYCKVFSGEMPLGGWDTDENRKKALCYFGGKRNEIARASSTPAIRALDSRPCEGQIATPNAEPHP